VSKNVAVFVDVANIFYAAKAAGVDIDYVQMLKTASAGRDLVRAYAYTGLDPENENQRQFHSFLARHGYKVVSKDIRKYGDGKTKANLDIELVVDLMRTARNLDIAVVVSGDGDFAPAIRAVQDQGVRVEVISFRANTSSDLIDVADLFTDITQIARVEKGSSRSGRRVASDEEDLSMTAVPEKESDGTGGRRRRGSRGRGSERATRETTAEAPASSEPSEEHVPSLVVLPGERLSRAPASAEQGDEEADGSAPESADGRPAADGEGGRRRRRRRGGRGRGRGREHEAAVGAEASEEEEGVEGLVEFEAPRVPQHSTFGSVWDSQLGVTPGAVPSGEAFELDEDEEPEIPEYLLSERRQRGSRGRGAGARRPRGRAGAYQTALERERFGTGRNALPTPAYDGGRRGGRSSGSGRERPFGGRGAPPPRAPREEREHAASGGQPWSEVPPELEEQLRAELARKRSERAPAEASAPVAEEAKPKRASRSRKSAAATGAGEEAVGPEEAKPKRASRTRKAASGSAVESVAAETPTEAAKVAPKRATRSRASAGSTAKASSSDDETVAPKRRTTRTRKAVESTTGG
jgi:uncharacterized LabA/DUF88 family protein